MSSAEPAPGNSAAVQAPPSGEKKLLRFSPATTVWMISSRFFTSLSSSAKLQRETSKSANGTDEPKEDMDHREQSGMKNRASILKKADGRTDISRASSRRTSFSVQSPVADGGTGIPVGGAHHRGSGASRYSASSAATHQTHRSNSQDSVRSAMSAFSGICCSFWRIFVLPEWAKNRMRAVLKSNLWFNFMVLFTLLLLFGAQIQELWMPKAADPYMDIAFTVCMVFMFSEIIMKSLISADYFNVVLCGRNHRVESNNGENLPKMEKRSYWHFSIGSFLFWCDLISTASLVFDISYIYDRLRIIDDCTVHLDERGIPQRLDPLDPGFIQFEEDILVAIGRTARVGRFLRPSVVLRTSSKVNWYWITEKFNPYFWVHLFCCRSSKRRKKRRQEPVKSTPKQQVVSYAGISLTQTTRAKRRLSISSDSSLSASVQNRPWNFREACLSFFHLRPKYDAEKHSAARKIQRAWRASHGTIERSRPEQRGKVRKKLSSLSTTSLLPSSVKQSLLGNAGVLPKTHRRRSESQVGNAMRELTAQRVAVGIVLALVLTSLLTHDEPDATDRGVMVLLHGQTQNEDFRGVALEAARECAVPTLFEYTDVNGNTTAFNLTVDIEDLREREKRRVTVRYEDGVTGALEQSQGMFSILREQQDKAMVSLVSTALTIIIWFVAVTAFAGPVMTLVVTPIERMVQLLEMLTWDPLGYENSSKFKKFSKNEGELTKNTMWTKEMLNGMETSFLMSTILKIGSLMKVGFGTAGVGIIKKNLQQGYNRDVLYLNTRGTTVSCIFLFCDVRQFTNATESLQEEVFVFTNKIAAVVHSYCHAFGGSANKNIGDAFLVSWQLDDPVDIQTQNSSPESFGPSKSFRFMKRRGSQGNSFTAETNDELHAKNNQADKALLCVVKISIALNYDDEFLEPLGENARARLLSKLSKRKGPVVQMGVGLHAGKAVQGAIGSQRKLDATYVSEAVEFAEYLESSTKKYGLKVLMSDAFHTLLHPSNKRRCRKIDQICISEDDDDRSDAGLDYIEEKDIMNLFTFDMDIDALWRTVAKGTSSNGLDGTGASSRWIEEASMDGSIRLPPMSGSHSSSSRDMLARSQLKSRRATDQRRRRTSVRQAASVFLNRGLSASGHQALADFSERKPDVVVYPQGDVVKTVLQRQSIGSENESRSKQAPKLALPSGPNQYNPDVWICEDMRKIRQLYSDGLFFQKYNAGLQSFYARDWDHAQQCFQTILDRFEDGPSKYFLKIIEDNDGVPPRNFTPYGTA